jgi:hypothetical protein
MVDWMTWSIEAAGIVIFCVWVVVPIREFREIIRRFRGKSTKAASGVMRPPEQTTSDAGRQEAGK